MKGYIEHPGKAVETGGKFEHVMAITLDPCTDYKEGVIRCIKSRSGDVETSGYIDKSVLHKVNGDSLEHFLIGEQLEIRMARLWFTSPPKPTKRRFTALPS